MEAKSGLSITSKAKNLPDDTKSAIYRRTDSYMPLIRQIKRIVNEFLV